MVPCLSGQAGSRPAPGRVARPPCRPSACPRPAASGSPRPPASPPGRGQAGSRPGGSATLPAQGQPRPGSGRPPCGWPDLPGRPGRPQAGLRPGSLRLEKASNGSIFGGGIYTPPPTSSQPASSPLKTTIFASSNSIDLPIPPLKFVDSWRIEGEGPDLHLHRAVSLSPLFLLRDLVSRVSFVLTLDSLAHLLL